MGLNTGVLILNDGLGQIEAKPQEFVDKLTQTIQKGLVPKTFGVGYHGNAVTVFHESHADAVGVYSIGGNHANRLLVTYNGGKHYQQEDKVNLLKQIAEELGYNIVKKRVKNGPNTGS